jgi:hypothetical protein
VLQATFLGILLAAAPEALHDASRALDDLQYQAALDKLPPESAISGWRHEEVLEAFSTRALALLGLKREAEARDVFKRLFSIAPHWELPDQYGPRVRTFVSAVRADAVRSGALSVRFEGGLLRVTKDSFGFGRELEVSWREPGGTWQSAKLPLADRQPAPWPREQRLEVWGRVLGLEGSTLFEWASENAPIRLEPQAVVSVEGGAVRPLGALGVAGIGAGAAGLLSTALGVGFAISSQGAERARENVTRDEEGRINSLTQREAFSLDARAAADATAATVFLVTGGVLIAAGAGLLIFDRVRVTPAVGGAVLTIPLDATFAVESAR